MQSSINHNLTHLKEKGLTLVEVLVVAPMIILIIGTVIVAIVALTGESLVRRETNAVVYNVQTALDDIESDAQRSTTFLDTTGTVDNPQGKNNTTSPFTSSQPNTLIMKSVFTTTNPLDPNAKIIYTMTPNSCSGPDVNKNPPATYTTVYFVDSGTLWKRSIVPWASASCSPPYQKNSCSAAGKSMGGICSGVVEDEKILTNVSAMDVKYYAKPTDSSTTSPLSASTIEVSITVDTSIAGKPINYQAKTRTTSVNISGT